MTQNNGDVVISHLSLNKEGDVYLVNKSPLQDS